ncbi:MAG: DUF3833 domain-containing protein [Proteobacteria bacterium]|nr:DUF3833 domain-containing protein [Pseudomonadota bacterium]
MRSMFTAVLFLVLCGCAGIDVKQYDKNTPKFDLYQYFQGATTGWGIVLDRSGRLTRQFVVTIDGQVDSGGDLIMDEDFNWSDGEKSKRIWRIIKEGDHSYVGRAGDVIDKAQGIVYGNVLSWKYVLALDSEGTTWHMDFDDWMFLQPDNVLINRTTMSKFGLHFGEVIIVFSKVGK